MKCNNCVVTSDSCARSVLRIFKHIALIIGEVIAIKRFSRAVRRRRSVLAINFRFYFELVQTRVIRVVCVALNSIDRVPGYGPPQGTESRVSKHGHEDDDCNRAARQSSVRHDTMDKDGSDVSSSTEYLWLCWICDLDSVEIFSLKK